MLSSRSKSNWLIVFGIALAVNFFLLYSIDPRKIVDFEFKSFSVERVGGVLMLKLHRVVSATVPGEFYVSVYNHKSSCSVSKPHDLIEASRKTPFYTRFLSRLPACKYTLIPNHQYMVDVAYKINGKIYTRTSTVIFKAKDLK